jgi:hypothetical protein
MRNKFVVNRMNLNLLSLQATERSETISCTEMEIASSLRAMTIMVVLLML